MTHGTDPEGASSSLPVKDRSAGFRSQVVSACRRGAPQLVDHPIEVQTLAAPVWREGVGVDGDAVSFEPGPHRRQRPTGPVRQRRRFRQRTAVRPNELHVSGRIQRDPEPRLVHRPVVPAAEQNEVVERGSAAAESSAMRSPSATTSAWGPSGHQGRGAGASLSGTMKSAGYSGGAGTSGVTSRCMPHRNPLILSGLYSRQRPERAAVRQIGIPRPASCSQRRLRVFRGRF